MPANLPPDYYAAEERFRQAKTTEEKIRILEEMLAIMPKHKGTDHLKADLRGKLSRLQKEGDKKKTGVSRYNPYTVEREDCPQIVLIGSVNAGKSALMKYLTGAPTEVAEYPYTTALPFPGIFRHNHYRFQLIDLPPVMGDIMEGWMGDFMRTSEGTIVCLDVSREETLDEVVPLFKAIDSANVFLQGLKPGNPPLGTVPKFGIIALTKCDIALPEVEDIIRSQYGRKYSIIETSVNAGINKNQFASRLANTIGYIRVFTKIPGKKADLEEPYIIRRGETVIELAEDVHRDLAETFRFARVWGKKTFDGQRVGKEHLLEDEDIVELHA